MGTFSTVEAESSVSVLNESPCTSLDCVLLWCAYKLSEGIELCGTGALREGAGLCGLDELSEGIELCGTVALPEGAGLCGLDKLSEGIEPCGKGASPEGAEESSGCKESFGAGESAEDKELFNVPVEGAGESADGAGLFGIGASTGGEDKSAEGAELFGAVLFIAEESTEGREKFAGPFCAGKSDNGTELSNADELEGEVLFEERDPLEPS